MNRRTQQRQAWINYLRRVPKVQDTWTGWKRELLLRSSNMTMTDEQAQAQAQAQELNEQKLRGMVTRLKGALNAEAGALDCDLNDLELSKLSNAHMRLSKAVEDLRNVANNVAESAVRRGLRG